MNETEVVLFSTGMEMMSSLILALLAVFVILWILLIVAHWKMFQKAGEAGWKSIIPVYSDYIMYKIAWSTSGFWVYLVSLCLSVVFSLLSGDYAVNAAGQLVITGQGNFIFSALSYVTSLVMFIWAVRLCIKTALAFGKGAGFAFGLLFLPNIFTMILGFGDAKYLGPQE